MLARNRGYLKRDTSESKKGKQDKESLPSSHDLSRSPRKYPGPERQDHALGARPGLVNGSLRGSQYVLLDVPLQAHRSHAGSTYLHDWGNTSERLPASGGSEHTDIDRGIIREAQRPLLTF